MLFFNYMLTLIMISHYKDTNCMDHASKIHHHASD